MRFPVNFVKFVKTPLQNTSDGCLWLRFTLNSKSCRLLFKCLTLFKKHILALIRPSANGTFHRHNPSGLRLITNLRLELSHLRFCKFKQNFEDTLNLNCSPGNIETNIHHPLHFT